MGKTLIALGKLLNFWNAIQYHPYRNDYKKNYLFIHLSREIQNLNKL